MFGAKTLRIRSKFCRFHYRRKKNSGMILIIILWVMVILSVLAVSLGRNTSVELSLTKHAIGKLKAKYLAWAGLVYAMEQIRLDTEDTQSRNFDTLYYCAIPKESEDSPEGLFHQKPVGEGYFSVEHSAEETDSVNLKNYNGLRDEERFINLNGLNARSVNILRTLITLLGFDDESAQTIVYSLIDWKDKDSSLSHETYGAEDEFYTSQTSPYHCKNLPFESKEELLLVRGMTEEIFQKLKSYITIFPRQGNLKVNFDTAPELVLTAVARALSGPATGSEIADADSLVEKILDYRSGEDGGEFTQDDRQIELSAMPVNAVERNIFLQMNQFRTKKSDYLRVFVKGVDQNSNIETHIESVVQRNDLAIMYWKRN